MKLKITKTRVIICSIIGAIAIAGTVWGCLSLVDAINTINIRTFPANLKSAKLIEEGGKIAYEVKNFEGTTSQMSPDTFAAAIYKEHQAQGFWTRVLVKVFNITSIHTVGWVVLGLLGQLVFAGRMIVQIIASEKKRQSVVPVAFWWMALAGASMLLLYFVWRKDVVGIIGQSTGWLIYTRNLYFIYLKPADHDTYEDTQEGNLGTDVNGTTES
ncbi:lipid-A-disaccharide synthase N-terminal domain-containing protein [Poriferisphaera sp. WC338]|uniref:lipid-A-disaccharide synthase N-terminal domain-containing protein n=1 Tax=Poriferisphaera sp. WC338 TaxID=3425129 RepID=UPI003D814F21